MNTKDDVCFNLCEKGTELTFSCQNTNCQLGKSIFKLNETTTGWYELTDNYNRVKYE